MTPTWTRRVLVVGDAAKIAPLLLDYLQSDGFDAESVGRVFSRAQLLDTVHSELRDVSDRAIDSHIKNLRRKIQTAEPGCDCIASIYGVGYRFEPMS